MWELLTRLRFHSIPDAVSWGAGNVQVFGVQGNNIVKNTTRLPHGVVRLESVNKPVRRESGLEGHGDVLGCNQHLRCIPPNVHTVLAAFRGSDGKVWMGNSVNGGSFTWSRFNPPATLTGDVDIAAWAPPRFDLFVLDTSGNLWDMVSTNGTTDRAPSMNFGHPERRGFQVGGSVGALGDGTALIGGRVGQQLAVRPVLQLASRHLGVGRVPVHERDRHRGAVSHTEGAAATASTAALPYRWSFVC